MKKNSTQVLPPHSKGSGASKPLFIVENYGKIYIFKLMEGVGVGGEEVKFFERLFNFVLLLLITITQVSVIHRYIFDVLTSFMII